MRGYLNKASQKFLLRKPILLTKSHNKSSFDCNDINLNYYLKNFALQNIKNNISKTYVSIEQENDIVAGYYTLTYGSISHEEATDKVKKRMPKYPIPIMILCRLGVSKEFQQIGLGKSLLKDSILKTLEASKIAGLKALLAHAKDSNAKRFYRKYGFEPSPIDNLHLMLPIQDIILASA